MKGGKWRRGTTAIRRPSLWLTEAQGKRKRNRREKRRRYSTEQGKDSLRRGNLVSIRFDRGLRPHCSSVLKQEEKEEALARKEGFLYSVDRCGERGEGRKAQTGEHSIGQSLRVEKKKKSRAGERKIHVRVSQEICKGKGRKAKETDIMKKETKLTPLEPEEDVRKGGRRSSISFKKATSSEQGGV